jgi:hypothetical protein
VQKVQQGPASSFVNIAGNARTAAISAIHIISGRHVINVIATHRRHPKAARADSESQTLAIKKFSRLGGPRLIGARQKPNFWTNRRHRFAGVLVATMNFQIATSDRRALASIDRDDGNYVAVPLRDVFRCRVLS